MAALRCTKFHVALREFRVTMSVQMEIEVPTMSEAWNTKYGPRRVRHDPPTLQEAIFAAKGLTDSLQAQAEIAASLMGLPVETVRPEVLKSAHDRGRATRTIATERGMRRAVVVEHRTSRRPARTA
jgi:hypothetical protein